MVDGPVTAQTIDLVGAWRLVAVCSYVGDELEDGFHNGPDPVGFIHYLPQGRVAVLVADGGRPRPTADARHLMTDAEHARADSTFNAYGGTYDRDGATVVHHLDICSFEPHVGTDYVRRIEVDGDLLVLGTPPQDTDAGPRVVKLSWRRA